ncbi:glycosyltransferase [Fibrella forsythiae]|uniref:Glycosyltransferase n=1 Tax=Fibrella forsythiae TaxID=2817061 RepID=A0ABS3JFY0_9BACT|nr:glycosyltransferase [Fibrella forsythiae]MBO0948900.1 glycosyltransferase [Fibrella forsythiae]
MFHLTPLAERLGIPVIVQINELNSMFESVSYQEMAHAMSFAELTVGITQHICKLAIQMGARDTALQYCFTNTVKHPVSTTRIAQLRQSLRLPESVFVWIMVGTPIYRKGIDFIPAIAQALQERPCHIIWLGSGTVDTGLNFLIQKQIETMGLQNVTFLGVQTDDYHAYLQLANGFVLTSREEPFGNVLIDAASLGKPIVASGEYGASEFMLPGMGELVDYTSPAHFARAMMTVMDNPGDYKQDVSVARSHHFDTAVQVKHWQELMNRLP